MPKGGGRRAGCGKSARPVRREGWGSIPRASRGLSGQTKLNRPGLTAPRAARTPAFARIGDVGPGDLDTSDHSA